MEVVVVGCSGSLAGPTNPASGYLIVPDSGNPLIVDIGPGVLAGLQRMGINPSTADVALSHLHADHCMDFPSLLVWRRYHPTEKATAVSRLAAPGGFHDRLGPISADEDGHINDVSDTFSLTAWEDRRPLRFDGLTLTPYRAVHPVEAYSLRIEEPSTSKVIAYSGDSAMCTNLVEVARGADVFFCEACWGATSQGKAPDMHISGEEAGIAARRAGVDHLVLVHIPPWEDPEDAARAARREFSGPVTIARPGDRFEV